MKSISRDPQECDPNNGKRDPYYSHIFRDSGLGVGLGNSMGSLHKEVPWPISLGAPENPTG